MFEESDRNFRHPVSYLSIRVFEPLRAFSAEDGLTEIYRSEFPGSRHNTTHALGKTVPRCGNTAGLSKMYAASPTLMVTIADSTGKRTLFQEDSNKLRT
ncbi:hypothetical protein RRG08_036596 [Elysia crispata]|uniref:Uncharacterized protein n=1 Tax=Elysia crispata TaxID=231223 RepID=A0AAE0ZS12_9GAST|nr:hypothetical protein RRG08_036596 [Elysia crispata]